MGGTFRISNWSSLLGESARHVGQVVVPPATDLTATSLSLPKEFWLSILSEALGIDIYETFTWRIKLTETQFCAFLVSESANAMVDLMSRLVQVQDPNSLFSDPVAMLSVCYNSSSCITNFNCRPGKNGAQ